MTTEEKLQKLYGIKDRLHPLSLVLVVGFTEVQQGKMREHDKTYIEEIYPLYFLENGYERKSTKES